MEIATGLVEVLNFKPLSQTHPSLAAQWDYSRNGELRPDDLGIGSSKLVWWKCDKGHFWQQLVNRRRVTAACSFCLNQRVWPGENDLATTNPELARQWHPSLNGSITPSDVSAGTPKKYWWKCDKGHEWLANVGMRNSGVGCAVCANRQVVAGINDLEHLEPEVAKEWNTEKNHGVRANQVTPGSNKKYWWLCSKGHAWKATPASRCFRKRTGCPYCSNQKVLPGFNDLQTTTPELASLWHPILNDPVSPRDVVSGSSRSFWWLCKEGHTFRANGDHLVRGRGCAVCAGRQIDVGVNDLATVRPELAREWDLAKNSLRPTEVTFGSNHKIWWLCLRDHSYQAAVSHRSIGGTGCPYCDNKVVFTGFNDLVTTHPEVAKRWHPTKNVPVEASQVIAGTAKKFWWQCDKGHSYRASGDAIMRGNGCSVCSNYSLVVGVNDLAHTNPEIAATWHSSRNGTLQPTDIVAGSHKKIWWQCDKGHEWEAQVVNRLYGNNCPSCSMGGFDPNRPGRLYFISNGKLNSRKVGITNFDSARLSNFGKFGWQHIKVWDFELGLSAREIERDFFYWLRIELGMAPHLDSVDIGKLGGWTETFAMDGISDLEIINKVDSLITKYESR